MTLAVVEKPTCRHTQDHSHARSQDKTGVQADSGWSKRRRRRDDGRRRKLARQQQRPWGAGWLHQGDREAGTQFANRVQTGN